jgi:dolichol-phosphate mannosyltransferase
MQILIEDIEGGAGNRQREEHANHGDASPLSGGCRKAPTSERPASPEEKECRQALAHQFGNRDWDVSEVDPRGHEPIKNAGLHLQREQAEVVRVERGMEAALDRGEVNRVIFDPGVVSFDEKRPGAYRRQQYEVPVLDATFQRNLASLHESMESRTMGPPLARSGKAANLCEETLRPPALALVIPTLREARNIQPLLSRVRAALDPCDFAYEVIVVDDDSRDGIDAIVADLAQEDPRIRLIVRTSERGLSGAVLRGWAETDADLLAVMDADLQHPPELLPKLWAELERGTDLVVGSRYACGGCMRGWKVVRQLISRIAIWMTLPVQRTGIRAHDPMSGFFMVRRSCIERIELQKSGFKILLEILARAEIRSVTEVPFAFGRRHAGASKANLRVAIDYVALLVRLYRQKGRTPSAAEREVAAASLRSGQEAVGS